MQNEVTNLLQESDILYLQCDECNNIKNESIIGNPIKTCISHNENT